jgi:predicted amidohydrolase
MTMDLTSVPPAPLTVAAGQARCVAGDVPANVATAAALVDRAAGAGAAVLVLPELFLSGYELAAIADAARALTVVPDDPRLDPLAEACARTRTAVVVGAPVRDADGVHISAVVLGRDGRYATRYDKQHLDAAERAAGLRPGAGGSTLTLDGWRFGLGVCWDASFPEHARAAALDGCHAYLVGAMFGGERGARKRATLGPARALDNANYAVFANHSGRSGPYQGCGGSAVWDPDGRPLADAGDTDPGLAVAVLEPGELARVRASDLVLTAPSLRVAPQPRSAVTLG